MRKYIAMSKFKIVFCSCLLMMAIGAGSVCADDEASNVVYVRSSKYGRSYAKCVPAEYYGSKGETKIYVVRDEDDQLESSYSWYSKEVYLQEMSGGISLVRMGPWARGREAKRGDLAIGFYFSGKALKEYSTLDIAGMPGNVDRSISHYTVFKTIIGYRELGNNNYAFDAVATDGREISFDVRTGEILKRSTSSTNRRRTREL
jgi:hypothetical protein